MQDVETFNCFSVNDHSTLVLRYHYDHPGPEVIKKISCSTQLSMKFILPINVKMPTIVGILTSISMIITTYVRLKARNFFFIGILVFTSS